MNLTNKDWETEVYQKSKKLAFDVISQAGCPITFAEICKQMRKRYPKLCDDSVIDPWRKAQPYWKHRVASALQSLKRKSIMKTPDGWVLQAGKKK